MQAAGVRRDANRGGVVGKPAWGPRRERGDGLHERQLAAIARAASSVADAAALDVTLDAVAQAVFDSTGLAGVQIVVLRGPDRDFQVLGTAGFADVEGFGGLLAECRQLGARLDMLQAIDSGEPVVRGHRRDALLSDPAWAPMHGFISSCAWDAFVSVPLVARDRCVGVLNAFYPPGEEPDDDAIAFLGAIADQAAMAVDYTELLAKSALDARRAERRRLTRDLHDSVLQQVFSLRLHATALSGRLTGTPDGFDRADVVKVSDELAYLAESALADLRELLFELRPGSLRAGLLDAVRAYASRVGTREGLEVTLDASGELPELPGELEADLYRIVQEALHNTVKHARARAVEIHFGVGEDELVVEIRDDGRGPAADGPGESAIGLASMRERAERWGGCFQAGAPGGGGYRIRVVIGDLGTVLARSGSGEEDDQW